MNLTGELDLCDDINILSNKDKSLKIGKLLGVESKTCNEIPNKGCNMAYSGMEGRTLMKDKQIFKSFLEIFITSSFQINQLFTNIIMYKEQKFTSHSKKI